MYIISACLLGENCKYNGGNNRDEKVLAFLADKEVVAVCPEKVLGIPRTPMEIVNGKLIDRDGVEVDGTVRTAIDKILDMLKAEPVEMAILKSRSPTCGVRQIYDGSFTGTLTDGWGTAAQLLQNAGLRVLGESELATFLRDN